jgi:hypothetical protein
MVVRFVFFQCTVPNREQTDWKHIIQYECRGISKTWGKISEDGPWEDAGWGGGIWELGNSPVPDIRIPIMILKYALSQGKNK